MLFSSFVSCFSRTLYSLSVPGKQERAELHAVLRTESRRKGTCLDSFQWLPSVTFYLKVIYSLIPLLLRIWNAFQPFECCYLLAFVFAQFFYCLKLPCMKIYKHEWVSEIAQLCPTLCDPVDCSLPGSCIHGILQARILEWVAISFSTESSRLRDRTRVSFVAGRRFNLWVTREAQYVNMCFCKWSTLVSLESRIPSIPLLIDSSPQVPVCEDRDT